MEAKLRIVGGQANKSEIKLKLPMTIGRNPGLGLTINHNMVSRLHCQIYDKDGALVVRDNNSSNGTQINDDYISEAVLKPGDRLTVGPLTFVAIYDHIGPFPSLDRPNMPVRPPAKAAKTPDPWGEDDTMSQMPRGSLGDDEERTSGWTGQASTGSGSQGGLGDLHANLMNLIADESPGSGVSRNPPMGPQPTGSPTPPPSKAAPDFILKIRFAQAGDVQEGTPVRAAGVSAGSVASMDFVEQDDQLFAEATVHVAKSLSRYLKDDLKIKLGVKDGVAVIDIVSPGKAGAPLASGHVVTVEAPPSQSSLPPLEKAPKSSEKSSSKSKAKDKPKAFSLEDLLVDLTSENDESDDAGSDSLDDGLGVLDSPSEQNFTQAAAPPSEKKTTDVGAFFEALTGGDDDSDDDDDVEPLSSSDSDDVLTQSLNSPPRPLPKRPAESDLILSDSLARGAPDALDAEDSDEELEEASDVEELDELDELDQLDDLVDERSAARRAAAGQHGPGQHGPGQNGAANGSANSAANGASNGSANGAGGKPANRDVSFEDFTFDDFAGDDVSHR